VEIGCLGKEGNHNVDWYLVAEAGGLLSAVGSYAWVIGSVALTLGFVIFVHELGHFLAAKACGVKCEKFYIGFDVPMSLGPLKLPAALCRFQWGETEYGIGSLPLGGYVKMLGQDDNPTAQARENERIRIPKDGADDPAADPSSAADASGLDSGHAAIPSSAPDAPDADAADQPFELDPRSYPAKPVWQRMIIISAGVVMNLIFAMVFAALAYTMGVRYVPCIIGETVANSPAWREGMRPEDQVLQIDRRWQPDEHLRFRRDLMPQVLLNGGQTPMELLVRPAGSSQADWMSIQPEHRLQSAQQAFRADVLDEGDRVRASIREQALNQMPPVASLGITSIKTTQLSPVGAAETFRLDDPAFDQLQSGDEIVAIDGVELARDAKTGKIFATQLEAELAARMTRPVTLTIQRTNTDQDSPAESVAKEFEVVLPPCPMIELGMTMQVGPIAGVRPGSPAARAGLQAGDRLLAIAGQPVGDPLTLPQRLLEYVEREIEIQVQRGGQSQTVRLSPQLPQTLGESLFYGAMLPIESLGIALPLANTVAEVQPDGPADRAGVQPGDEILTFRMELDDQARLEEIMTVFPGYDATVYLDRALPAWQYVHSMFLQRSVPGTEIHLSLLRDSLEPISVTMMAEPSNGWYNASRGLLLTGLSDIRRAGNWNEAWRLGFRETWESVTQVIRVLRGLLTGQVSWQNLGGPITIATVAGYEASEGFSQLLIFLTLLSANLAVLNFLPIPALDGGHMVFLIAEGIRGKPVDERLQMLLTIIGVAFLLGLILILSIKDIGTLLQLFG
jgi:regulator of sigma E protease